jgi:hypothetical protein
MAPILPPVCPSCVCCCFLITSTWGNPRKQTAVVSDVRVDPRRRRYSWKKAEPYCFFSSCSDRHRLNCQVLTPLRNPGSLFSIHQVWSKHSTLHSKEWTLQENLELLSWGLYPSCQLKSCVFKNLFHLELLSVAFYLKHFLIKLINAYLKIFEKKELCLKQ